MLETTAAVNSLTLPSELRLLQIDCVDESMFQSTFDPTQESGHTRKFYLCKRATPGRFVFMFLQCVIPCARSDTTVRAGLSDLVDNNYFRDVFLFNIHLNNITFGRRCLIAKLSRNVPEDVLHS